MDTNIGRKKWKVIFTGIVVFALLILPLFLSRAEAVGCERTITADVAALDQAFFLNRLGAAMPGGMIYALRRDVVDKGTGKSEAEGATLAPGQVMLRQDKRPRPITLRMNVGDCLSINFQNLLAPQRVDAEQPATRTAGVHVNGLQLVNSIADDGSNVGANASSLAAPGGTATYTLYAERENTYLLYSTAAPVGGEGNGGSLAFGLFGAVNVEPRGAEWYRSNVTRAEMEMATTVKTAAGQPIINYDAVYPAGHKFAGLPILKMLNGNQIVHSDLNAIITGPNRGQFSAGTYPPNPAYPNRNQPFREWTVIFHDEIGAVQAFPIFEDPQFKFTLHSVRDGFAINYGTGGVGAEIVANRLGVGPMWNCAGCKYEEFFLASWAVGDPAMVVDIPANADLNGDGQIDPGAKATKALYPDDPSNVHHSYINDHVKFRNLHAGPKEHHIFHLHAHQWLQTPDDDNSQYLDGQAIGPGSGYTYEIAYNGSGNRNKTPGDSIFHCHFYPHFAQGMWELWRSHDTFEEGTLLDVAGRPAPGARALPDGEIPAGSSIPAVVPIPGLAMPPMPGPVHVEAQDANNDGTPDNSQIVVDNPNVNPGYPFYIAAEAGHRPPTPPLDIVDDGGLPRHVLLAGQTHSVVTPLDFSKELVSVAAQEVPEAGTPVELTAMAFHAQRFHSSFTPEGSPAQFEANGMPPAPGAPYAEPCRDDNANPAGNPRTYKAAHIQFDMKINKLGWHFPQSRIISLWEDVQPTLNGQRPPEPFVMRANTNDCITYYHSNLVPHVYEMDDFQVRTPTDVIGQHIHLVKFDVTSADGSANGFNYEDGTMGPGEVIERINAINAGGGLVPFGGGQPKTLAPTPHPFFGTLGARTTVQRWFADPLLNNQGVDRGLGVAFTHDHYGPSTHQQIGVYSTLIMEPQGSTWRDPEKGTILGTRADGGPTSWHADILTPNPADSYREFYLEYGDFQLAYLAGFGGDGAQPHPDPAGAINPPGREEVGLPFIMAPPQVCPNGTLPPCPEAISADDPGTFVVNYRNEPVALRVRDPQANQQANGRAGDLSFAFSSRIRRADPALNQQPNFYPPLTADVGPGDPFTSLLRAYEGDLVKLRVQTGLQEEGHNVTVHGVKWLQEPDSPNSGWRNSQMQGIMESHTFKVPLLPEINQAGISADHLYSVSASSDGYWNGTWGIMRSYSRLRGDLLPLPNNPITIAGIQVNNANDFIGGCPKAAPQRSYDITAVAAQDALPGGTLVYNSRAFNGGPLHDPTAILYVRTEDLDSNGQLKVGVPIEPLILRANAGDCIEVTLLNNLPLEGAPDLAGFNTLPMIVNFFNANQVKPSSQVGVHPQLVTFDVTKSDGANVGNNPVQTVTPDDGASKLYRWYAGDIQFDATTGNLVAMPVEFGASNLLSSDRIKHSNKGAIGALITEPQGATWVEDAGSRDSATVTQADSTSFRDFVTLFQSDINLRFADGSPVPTIADAEDPEDSGHKGVNYRAEPIWFRLGIAPNAPLGQVRNFDFSNAFSNAAIGGADPETPIYSAKTGTPVRFRVLEPAGHQRNIVYVLHGHVWEREPYINNSSQIGNNPLSQWIGSQEGIGATSHFDVVPKHGAGGAFGIPGDNLYRDEASFLTYQGVWGIFRVTP